MKSEAGSISHMVIHYNALVWLTFSAEIFNSVVKTQNYEGSQLSQGDAWVITKDGFGDKRGMHGIAALYWVDLSCSQSPGEIRYIVL